MFLNNKKKIYIFIFCSHLLFGLILKLYCKICFIPSINWDSFWQNIPTIHLLHNGLKNILALHSQPPLHNLFYYIILHLFQPYQFSVWQILNLILGSIMMVLLFIIIDNLLTSEYLKYILFTVIFFNPAIFLYEVYPLYTFNTAFLVILTIFFLLKFSQNKQKYWYLCLFCLASNILILYRSSFHIIFLYISILIIWLFSYKYNKKKVIAICLFFSILSLSWYIKNYIQYGFFGTSSWFGLNLYKFVSTDFTPQLREKVLQKLDLPKSVTDNNHFYSEIGTYKNYGFNKNSKIKFLNENNFHNINIPDLSKQYKNSAVKIIKLFPYHYFKNMVKSYILFSTASYTYPQLEQNKIKIKKYINIYDRLIYFDGYIMKKFFGLRINIIHLILLSTSVVYITLLLLFGKKFLLKQKIVLLYIIVLVVYFTTVSCAFEIGENNRFRFTIESIIFLLYFLFIEKIISREKFYEKK